MNIADIELEADLKKLWGQLIKLHHNLRDYTWHKHKRVNPFNENLFEWKEKGEFVGGKNVTIFDSTTVVGDVTIGDNTWIGSFCSLDGTGRLTIGKFCSISVGTQIQTHNTVKWALSGGELPYDYKPVSIGDCCFIGANSVITSGVTIGNHCLIGAGAVVTNDIPDFSIALGVPARIKGRVIINKNKIDLHYF